MMCIRDIPLREEERDWTISNIVRVDYDAVPREKFIPNSG
jgi:hypothetical protein